ELLEGVLEEGNLYRVAQPEELRAKLSEIPLRDLNREDAALALAHFKRRQLLRITLRDVLGLATLAEVTLELSSLADAILEAALERVYAGLTAIYGRPAMAASERKGEEAAEFSVLALGKLGGQELNYSSDIDLLYLFGGIGHTEGPKK